MGAGAYVGRIGGLAVALGIGAAVFTGHGIASAGPPAPGSDGSSSGSTSDAAPNSTSPAAATKPAAVRPSAAHDASAKDESTTVPKSEPDSADAASDVGAGTTDEATTKPKRNRSKSASPATEHVDKPSADATPKDGHAKSRVTAQHEDASPSKTTTQSAGTDPAPKPSATVSAANATVSAADSTTPVAKAPLAEPAEQATPDSVESAATGMSEFVGSLVHSLTGHDPATPADPPLAWTVLAAARRESFGATAPALDGAAKPVTNALTIDARPDSHDARRTRPHPRRRHPLVAPLQGLQYLPVDRPAAGDPDRHVHPPDPAHRRRPAPVRRLSAAAGLPAGTPRPRDVKVVSFDGTQIYVHFFPATGLSPARTGPDDPRRSRPRRCPVDELPDREGRVPAERRHRHRCAAQRRLQRRHLGSARGVEFGRPTGDRLAGLRGPRRLRDHQLGGHTARSANSTTGEAAALDPRIGMVGASYGGGIQLVDRRHRPPHRRDRADDRLAQPQHVAVQEPGVQEQLGHAADRGAARPPSPARTRRSTPRPSTAT